MAVTVPRIVTLTTDFGVGSSYVAEVKARLLHARSPFTLIDITHDVAAHDIRTAAWLLAHTCPAFPPGSLHLVVIDPGVGTARRIVWVSAGGQEFVCPDNGLLSRVLETTPADAAHQLTIPSAVSTTFHGRDVFAPAAAALIDGLAPQSLGPPVNHLETFPIPIPRDTLRGLEGEVAHVDPFGNLLTNLPAQLLPRLMAAGRLIVGDHEVTRIVRTYGDAPVGTPVALVGSQGVLEAAVVQGRASETLGAVVGTPVVLP